MSTLQKIIIGALLFVTWGALVLIGQAPASDYVTALRDALIAIGVFHMSVPPNDPPGPDLAPD
ncbi:hypothetical protein [Polynucleobacter asymbioticus]|uniref:Uncharacterized protein n=1 Tax=Polynucleobacter asymbioticus TaxID=576611 RepID=A0AAC9ISI3_9BURK|nr:hypothetical protein [Polynucleobacter asymbioticus]APB99004.1 hypothetical protein A4F89_06530 [Polynucleobacter asymbioticus]APC01306.1 hypothetical protein AOC25_06630 [Polynucleobacter asymbioticus]